MDNNIILSIAGLSYTTKKRVYHGLISYFKPQYKEITVLHDVNLQVQAGHLIGIIGPSGAGKSTLVQMIAGIDKASSGTITLLGHEPKWLDIQQQAKVKLISNTYSNLWPELSTREVLPLIREKYQIPHIEITDMANEISDMLGISDVLKIQSRKLSPANKLKCELLIALLTNPQLIIIDEILDEVDSASHRKLYELLTLIQNRWQLTIIVTSQSIDTIANLSENIVLMNEGKVIYQGTLTELINKYANYQYMDILFERPTNAESVSNYGKVVKGEGLFMRLMIPRDSKGYITSELLQKLPVKDIQVSEPPVSEIAENVLHPEPQQQIESVIPQEHIATPINEPINIVEAQPAQEATPIS